jgi:hypothetical protein
LKITVVGEVGRQHFQRHGPVGHRVVCP